MLIHSTMVPRSTPRRIVRRSFRARLRKSRCTRGPNTGSETGRNRLDLRPTLTWTFENEDAGISILSHPRSTDEPLADFAGTVFRMSR